MVHGQNASQFCTGRQNTGLIKSIEITLSYISEKKQMFKCLTTTWLMKREEINGPHWSSTDKDFLSIVFPYN